MNECWKEKKQKIVLSGIIYIILILSIFGDILRISGSAITFFRLSLPVAFLILALYPYWTVRYLGIMIGIILISAVQYCLLYNVIHPELEPINNYFIRYMFFYACMVLVFFLVKLIQMNNQFNFEMSFAKFLIGIGVIILVITLINEGYPLFFKGIELDNPNNYSCYMAAVFPLVLVKLQVERKLRYFFLIFFLFIAILLCDAKAALFGCVVQLAIFCALLFQSQNAHKVLRWRCMIVLLGAFVLVGILIWNPQLHGYTMRGTILEPIIRIVQNDPYSVYTTSITYRTNTTLFAIWEVIRTCGIGLGAGNTGVLLKSEFPELNPEYHQALNASTLSLHNSWLEFALDVGLIVIIIYIVVFVYGIRLYFRKSDLTQIERSRVIYILSFPIWMLGPSGVYTLYYLLLTMAFLLFANKNKPIAQVDSYRAFDLRSGEFR